MAWHPVVAVGELRMSTPDAGAPPKLSFDFFSNDTTRSWLIERVELSNGVESVVVAENIELPAARGDGYSSTTETIYVQVPVGPGMSYELRVVIEDETYTYTAWWKPSPGEMF